MSKQDLEKEFKRVWAWDKESNIDVSTEYWLIADLGDKFENRYLVCECNSNPYVEYGFTSYTTMLEISENPVLTKEMALQLVQYELGNEFSIE